MRHVVSSRGDSDSVSLELEVIPVTDNEHLMRVGVYTVIQPTKDGRNVMPYDYPYGTGSMYFRPRWHIPIWLISNNGEVLDSHKIAELSKKKKDRLPFCKTCSVPDNWLFCQGFLLPTNYIAVDMFEAIYKTHNCFRAFCSMNKKQWQEMMSRIAEYRGVTLEDFEARMLCSQCSRELFGTADTRKINSKQRLVLAQKFRREHHLSFRQLPTLVRLPEMEIKSYC